THNRFYGGQVGANAEVRRGRLSLEGRAKVALGVTNQTIDVNGFQTITTPAGVTSQFTGGLPALPTNIGHFTQNRFSVVPDVGVRVGYYLSDNVRVYVGYDLLYWSSVVRPGDQIDLVINASQIPNFLPAGTPAPTPPVRPVVPFR